MAMALKALVAMQKWVEDKNAESECLFGKDISPLRRDNSELAGLETEDALGSQENVSFANAVAGNSGGGC